MKIDAEFLTPHDESHALGEGAYFDLRKVDEQGLASAIAILLYRNAGGGHNVYRERATVGIETLTKAYKIFVVEVPYAPES